MRNLGDELSERQIVNRCAKGLTAILLTTYLIGGTALGARARHEYKDPAAADNFVVDALGGGSVGEVGFTILKPTIRVGYWLNAKFDR